MKGTAFKFTVTSLLGTEKAEHVYGKVGNIQKWELRKIVTKLMQAHPDSPAKLMQQTMESYYHEDDGTDDSTFHRAIAAFFPFVLNWFRDKKLSQADKAMLWIIACYWYKHCGGPFPGTKAEKATHKRVKTDSWKQDLCCPICHAVPSKKVIAGEDESVVLEQFGQWTVQHSKKCQSKLSIMQLKERIKKDQEQEAAREQGYERIHRQYLEAKAAEPEIRRALNQAWAQIDKLNKERDAIRALQIVQDGKDFAVAVTKAKVAMEKGLEPLTIKEQYRLATVIQAVQRVEELLEKIKGQKGVTAQRQSLQADLKVLKSEYKQLEERRMIAGEENVTNNRGRMI